MQESYFSGETQRIFIKGNRQISPVQPQPFRILVGPSRNEGCGRIRVQRLVGCDNARWCISLPGILQGKYGVP